MVIFMLITGSGKNHQWILKADGKSFKQDKIKYISMRYLLNTKTKSYFLVKNLFLSEKPTVYHFCRVIHSSITNNRTNLHHDITDIIY